MAIRLGIILVFCLINIGMQRIQALVIEALARYIKYREYIISGTGFLILHIIFIITSFIYAYFIQNTINYSDYISIVTNRFSIIASLLSVSLVIFGFMLTNLKKKTAIHFEYILVKAKIVGLLSYSLILLLVYSAYLQYLVIKSESHDLIVESLYFYAYVSLIFFVIFIGVVFYWLVRLVFMNGIDKIIINDYIFQTQKISKFKSNLDSRWKVLNSKIEFMKFTLIKESLEDMLAYKSELDKQNFLLVDQILEALNTESDKNKLSNETPPPIMLEGIDNLLYNAFTRAVKEKNIIVIYQVYSRLQLICLWGLRNNEITYQIYSRLKLQLVNSSVAEEKIRHDFLSHLCISQRSEIVYAIYYPYLKNSADYEYGAKKLYYSFSIFMSIGYYILMKENFELFSFYNNELRQIENIEHKFQYEMEIDNITNRLKKARNITRLEFDRFEIELKNLKLQLKYNFIINDLRVSSKIIFYSWILYLKENNDITISDFEKYNTIIEIESFSSSNELIKFIKEYIFYFNSPLDNVLSTWDNVLRKTGIVYTPPNSPDWISAGLVSLMVSNKVNYNINELDYIDEIFTYAVQLLVSKVDSIESNNQESKERVKEFFYNLQKKALTSETQLLASKGVDLRKVADFKKSISTKFQKNNLLFNILSDGNVVYYETKNTISLISQFTIEKGKSMFTAGGVNIIGLDDTIMFEINRNNDTFISILQSQLKGHHYSDYYSCIAALKNRFENEGRLNYAIIVVDNRFSFWSEHLRNEKLKERFRFQADNSNLMGYFDLVRVYQYTRRRIDNSFIAIIDLDKAFSAYVDITMFHDGNKIEVFDTEEYLYALDVIVNEAKQREQITTEADPIMTKASVDISYLQRFKYEINDPSGIVAYHVTKQQ